MKCITDNISILKYKFLYLIISPYGSYLNLSSKNGNIIGKSLFEGFLELGKFPSTKKSCLPLMTSESSSESELSWSLILKYWYL